MIGKILSSAALVAAIATPALAPSVAHAGTTLDNIRKAGTLRCAVNSGLQGFSAPDSKGVWTGIDAEYCKA
ncbi:MAG: amino acid ABC transporter substrate-binding protein, partial [Burkholderiaceae bacterium]